MLPSGSFPSLVEAVQESPPKAAVVLGSGLGPVAGQLQRRHTVSFGEIPGLVAASVHGHSGCLTLGDWAGRRVLVFEGRLHYYEGHPWERVVRPVQLARELGVRVLLLTNAAGGIRDDLIPGSLLVLREHLNWTRPYCWREPGPGGLGPGRPSPYAPRLRELLARIAADQGQVLPEGNYAQVTGPSYETPAEIRALRACGADAVGMSTAREVEIGLALGMECAAISCITNRAAGLSTGPIHHGEVLATAATQAERLAKLIQGFLRHLTLTP